MTMKKQLGRLKENWFIIALFIIGMIMVFAVSSGGMRSISKGAYSTDSMSAGTSGRYAEYYSQYSSNELRPDIVDRIIVKTAAINLEVKEYDPVASIFKNAVKANHGLITSENVNEYNGYYSGHYTVRVPLSDYDALAAQLKTIGEVKSFNENSNDITGSYINLKDRIAIEKEKLAQYRNMYDESTSMTDKIQLIDRIASQESLITSLTYELADKDEEVSYTTIQVSISQKRPSYSSVVMASFGDLWASFKTSTNGVLYTIAYVLPFALVAGLIWGIVRLIRRH